MLARRLTVASAMIYLAFVVGAVLLAAIIYKHFRAGDLPASATEHWGILVAAALVYAASHFVRSIRLYVILLDMERSYTRILGLYATLTFVNRMFPWKLGELFRLFEFTHLFRSPRLALVVIATERFFDAAILFWLLLYGLVLDASIVEDTTVLLILLSAVVIFGALTYRGLPGFARYLRFLAATRSRGRRGLTALRLAAWIDEIWRDVNRLLRGRAVVLALISFVVWALEIAAMGLIVNVVSAQDTGEFAGALLRALNSLLADGAEKSLDAIEIYFVITYAVIVIFGLPLILLYSFLRFRAFGTELSTADAGNSRYVRDETGPAV